MILVLVAVGFAVGGGAAVVALAGGAGLVSALLSYLGFAVAAVVASALLAAVVPVWRAEPPGPPRRLEGGFSPR